MAHLLAFFSILYSSAPVFLKAIVTLFVLFSFFYHLKRKEPSVYLFWNLDEQSVKLSFEKCSNTGEASLSPFEPCVGIKELHLVFGVLYLSIQRKETSDIKLIIFPDSVDSDSYRKLLVASRWIKLKE